MSGAGGPETKTLEPADAGIFLFVHHSEKATESACIRSMKKFFNKNPIRIVRHNSISSQTNPSEPVSICCSEDPTKIATHIMSEIEIKSVAIIALEANFGHGKFIAPEIFMALFKTSPIPLILFSFDSDFETRYQEMILKLSRNNPDQVGITVGYNKDSMMCIADIKTDGTLSFSNKTVSGIAWVLRHLKSCLGKSQTAESFSTSAAVPVAISAPPPLSPLAPAPASSTTGAAEPQKPTGYRAWLAHKPGNPDPSMTFNSL